VFAPFAQNLRLMSMILMLVVIGITVHRNGRWRAPAMVAGPIAAENEPAPVVKEAKEPAATDPVETAATKAEAPAAQQADPDNPVEEHAGASEPARDESLPPTDGGLSDETGSAGPTQDEAGAGDSAPPRRDDRDQEEAVEFRRQAEAINDWGLAIQGIENPAYWRLLSWVGRQSLAELQKRDPPAAVFQQLRQHPGKYRGKLLSLELSVRRVVTYDLEKENPAGVKRLYELWGWPTAGRGWFYVVVTPELPPGFPIEADVTQTVKVYGYFFKLQGYQPANAQLNAAPLAAPMIVGRVEWVRMITPTNPAEVALSYVVLGAGGLLVLGVIGYWIIAARRKKAVHRARVNDYPAISARGKEDDDSGEFERNPYRNAYDDDDDEHDSDRPPPGAFDWVRD
jgi:hypothetical protein